MEKNKALSRHKIQFLRPLSKAEDVQTWFEKHHTHFHMGFLGRSNVGKSSLINALFAHKIAKTSKTPGRTQEIIVFQVMGSNDQPLGLLYDLPGYGFAKVSKAMSARWDQLMSSFFESFPQHSVMLNIQDARHPQQPADLRFQDWVKHFPEFDKVLILNKIDKLRNQKEKSHIKSKVFLQQLKLFTKIYYTSAERQESLEDLGLFIRNYYLS